MSKLDSYLTMGVETGAGYEVQDHSTGLVPSSSRIDPDCFVASGRPGAIAGRRRSRSGYQPDLKSLAEQVQAHAGYTTQIEDLMKSSIAYRVVKIENNALTLVREESDAFFGKKPIPTT